MTNFQDLVAKVKDLVALVPVLGTISRPDLPIRMKILKCIPCIPLLSFLFVLQVIGRTISLLSQKNVLVSHVSSRISALIFPLTTRRLVEWSTSGGKVSVYLQCLWLINQIILLWINIYFSVIRKIVNFEILSLFIK